MCDDVDAVREHDKIYQDQIDKSEELDRQAREYIEAMNATDMIEVLKWSTWDCYEFLAADGAQLLRDLWPKIAPYRVKTVYGYDRLSSINDDWDGYNICTLLGLTNLDAWNILKEFGEDLILIHYRDDLIEAIRE